MIIKCPNCGVELEVADGLAEGQHVRCPDCGAKFEWSVKGSVLIGGVERHFEEGCKWRTSHTFILLSSVVALFFLVFCIDSLCKGQAGQTMTNWSASNEISPNGENEVQILITTDAKKSYLKNVFQKGFMLITLKPEDRTVGVFFSSDKHDDVGKLVYYRSSFYQIYDDKQWSGFAKEINDHVKSPTAQEVIDYVSKFR